MLQKSRNYLAQGAMPTKSSSPVFFVPWRLCLKPFGCEVVCSMEGESFQKADKIGAMFAAY